MWWTWSSQQANTRRYSSTLYVDEDHLNPLLKVTPAVFSLVNLRLHFSASFCEASQMGPTEISSLELWIPSDSKWVPTTTPWPQMRSAKSNKSRLHALALHQPRTGSCALNSPLYASWVKKTCCLSFFTAARVMAALPPQIPGKEAAVGQQKQ